MEEKKVQQPAEKEIEANKELQFPMDDFPERPHTAPKPVRASKLFTYQRSNTL